MKDESENPPHLPAELHFALDLIPWLGSPLSRYLERLDQQHGARIVDFVRKVVGSEPDPRVLLDQITSNERLSDMFAKAMESASRTRLDEKRSALAKIIRAATCDDARLDELELMNDVLVQLEPRHAAVMAQLCTWIEGKVYKSSIRTDFPDEDSVAREAVLLQLSGWGIARRDDLADTDLDSLQHIGRWTLSDFGLRLVKLLTIDRSPAD